MTAVTKEQVLGQLRTVNDPELHKDLVTLKMVKDVAVTNGRVKVHVELTTPACPLKDQIGRDVEAAVRKLPGVEQVELQWSAQVRAGPRPRAQLPGVKNIVAVGAGKGGVGKSTVAVLLAIGLRRAGATVGLLDADVYGPSVPTLMGVEGVQPKITPERLFIPIDVQGVKMLSTSLIVPRGQSLVLRGPMAQGIVKQFLDQTDWGELDYLIVDLPPGTGDIPLTLAQSVPLTGWVVVCTPQDVALNDARRAINMYNKLNVPCIGIIENMSYYLCPKCGHRDEIFDHGGAAAVARELGVPFLGEIPLNADLRRFGDAGVPEHSFTKAGGDVASAIQKVVEATAGQISVKNLLQVSAPTLTIE